MAFNDETFKRNQKLLAKFLGYVEQGMPLLEIQLRLGIIDNAKGKQEMKDLVFKSIINGLSYQPKYDVFKAKELPKTILEGIKKKSSLISDDTILKLEIMDEASGAFVFSPLPIDTINQPDEKFQESE